MNSFLVSVIIPTYNREKLLQESIESVYGQTYRPIEVIIVDDGSTDDTECAVQECVEQYEDDNFKVIFLEQENKGPGSARNTGFAASSGEFIQFLDSDDVLLAHKLMEEVNYLQTNDCDLVYAKAQFVDENLVPVKGKYWGERLTGTELDYFNFSWQTMCALYRRETLIKGGDFIEELILNDDWEFNIRYILLGFKIDFIDKVNSLYRTHNLERIGSKLETVTKIDSKVKSTIMIRDLVIAEKKSLSPALDRKYFKRLLFCVFLYGAVKAKKEKRNLLKYIKNEFSSLSFSDKALIKLLKNTGKGLDHFVLKVYSMVV